MNKSHLHNITVAQLTTDAHLEEVILETGDAIGIRANNLRIDESIFERTLYIDAHLEKLNCTDTTIKGCDFSTTHCSESTLTRVHFSDCRMTGADFSRGALKDVTFENCKLDMANFRQTKLHNVQFVDCVMNEADFQGAELTGVAYKNCQLEKNEFTLAKLKNVDLRSSQLFDIRGWSHMKGTILDHAQLMAIAPELAMQLGIEVKD